MLILISWENTGNFMANLKDSKSDIQRLGALVPNWQGAKFPDSNHLKDPSLQGLHGYLARIQNAHLPALYRGFSGDGADKGWDYLPYGPFQSLQDFQQWARTTCIAPDSLKNPQTNPMFFTVFDNEKRALGMLSYLNINEAHGSIEIGHIHFAPSMQRQTLSTEAIYLLIKAAFDLGYRRLEWKCNNLNDKSMRAAVRLGFQYEGCFRQMMVVKGRNRDSAWFSILDNEWQNLQQGFEKWFAVDNFDKQGQQKQKLQDFIHFEQ